MRGGIREPWLQSCSVSKQKPDAMVKGRPSSITPHAVCCAANPSFGSVTMVSAAEGQLCSWGSTQLPQRMMADVKPTATVEQCSALAASWSLVVTHFPMTMTLQGKAVVLKWPLCAGSGARDKLHICLLPEAQSKGPENSTVLTSGRLPVGEQHR